MVQNFSQGLQQISPMLLALGQGLSSGQGAALLPQGIEMMRQKRMKQEGDQLLASVMGGVSPGGAPQPGGNSLSGLMWGGQAAPKSTPGLEMGRPRPDVDLSAPAGAPVDPMQRAQDAMRQYGVAQNNQDPGLGFGERGTDVSGPPDLINLFSSVEQNTGLPQGYLARTAQIESGMNPAAKNPNSSATGLFQFIDSTARQYGVDQRDARSSTIGAARLAKDNQHILRRTLGRDPTAAELYLAHQQGGGGAAKLLGNPNARAADIVGGDAVRLNGGNMNMTAGEFANLWISKFNRGAGGGQSAGAAMSQAGGGIDPQRLISVLQHPGISDQAKQFVLQQAQARAPQATAGMQEYNFARQNGFEGSFMDFLAAKRGGGNDSTAAMREFEFARQNGFEGSFMDFIGSKRPGTNVTVNMPGDTNAPRDPGKLAESLSKADVAMIEEERTRARTAGDIMSLANQLEQVIERVGYTGPLGDVYGGLDDAIGVLPGDAGARGAFRSLAMEAQLSFTEKTKGAITDREMRMFREAVPNLSQTRRGNQQIVSVMKASAGRAQMRAEFMEDFARRNGSLEGAQGAWRRYMEDNPLIEMGQSGFKVNEFADYSPYLSGGENVGEPITIDGYTIRPVN